VDPGRATRPRPPVSTGERIVVAEEPSPRPRTPRASRVLTGTAHPPHAPSAPWGPEPSPGGDCCWRALLRVGARSLFLARALGSWRALLGVGAWSWLLARGLGCWRAVLAVGAVPSWPDPKAAVVLHEAAAPVPKRLRQSPRGRANSQEAAPTPKRPRQLPRGRARNNETAPTPKRARRQQSPPTGRAGGSPTVRSADRRSSVGGARGVTHVERREAGRGVPHPPERPQRGAGLAARSPARWPRSPGPLRRGNGATLRSSPRQATPWDAPAPPPTATPPGTGGP
jgi:hypothetical protein